MISHIRERGEAETLASANIREADGDCRAALLQLARTVDRLEGVIVELRREKDGFERMLVDHMIDCYQPPNNPPAVPLQMAQRIAERLEDNAKVHLR